MDWRSILNTTSTAERLIDGLSTILGDAEDQSTYGRNQSGAFLFFSYIAAALLLTGSILVVLWNTYRQLDSNQKVPIKVKKGLLLRCGLAFLSFNVLSYHMLMFLVESYMKWALVHGIAVPNTLSPSDIRKQLHLWQWASNTSLFTAFAYEIFHGKQIDMITGLALAWELMQAVYIVEIAGESEMKHVWMYVLLTQILPISFVQNLFEIARVLDSCKPKPVVQIHQDWRVIASIPVPLLFSFGIPAIYASTITLISSLYKAQQQIIPAVLMTRILLSTSYLAWISVPGLLPRLHLYPMFGHKYVLFMACVCILKPKFGIGLEIKHQVDWLQQWNPSSAFLLLCKKWTDSLKGMQESHAVAALGWDVLIAIASWMLCSIDFFQESMIDHASVPREITRNAMKRH